MVKKFEVGKMYYTDDARYIGKGSNQKLGYVRKYWLCVKRNDSTGYVSFKKYLGDNVWSDSYSRKVSYVYEYGKAITEVVKIGYGGDGMWRNWYSLDARNKKD